MKSKKDRLLAKLRLVGVAAGVVAVVAALVWIARSLLSEPTSPRKAQQITLIATPPPPPPPKTEKPPEPPKIKEEIKIDQPKVDDAPKPDNAPEPPPGPLGVDAQGSGAGDSFGLAARPGGRDIIGSGGGFGGASLFANSTARFLAQELGRVTKLRGVDYRVELKVWFAKDGRIERWELVRGTGDAEVDRAIRDGLAQVGAMKQQLPDGLQQPLRIRVTSTDA